MMRIAGCLAIILAVASSPAVAADSPVGKWTTLDEKTGKPVSQVEIYDQGGKLFGKIISLTEPNNPYGQPKTCIRCSGAEKDKPIIGLVIMRDMAQTGDRYKGGTIMDPEDGKVYQAEIWVEDGKLKLRGHVGPFYKTRTWLRAG